mmetsp:Transcript_10112/g.17746  ORF Transcript_10112/g.17746 Transcript_10112/m.17746 type:complete len:225 (+) Transcript_10112:1231-1905(+)
MKRRWALGMRSTKSASVRLGRPRTFDLMPRSAHSWSNSIPDSHSWRDLVTSSRLFPRHEVIPMPVTTTRRSAMYRDVLETADRVWVAIGANAAAKTGLEINMNADENFIVYNIIYIVVCTRFIHTMIRIAIVVNCAEKRTKHSPKSLTQEKEHDHRAWMIEIINRRETVRFHPVAWGMRHLARSLSTYSPSACGERHRDTRGVVKGNVARAGSSMSAKRSLTRH